MVGSHEIKHGSATITPVNQKQSTISMAGGSSINFFKTRSKSIVPKTNEEIRKNLETLTFLKKNS